MLQDPVSLTSKNVVFVGITDGAYVLQNLFPNKTEYSPNIRPIKNESEPIVVDFTLSFEGIDNIVSTCKRGIQKRWR